MPALEANLPTLVDIASRMHPDGSVTTDIIEYLSLMTPIVKNGIALPCNNGTKHRTTIRTGLPDVTWRRFNERVKPTKSTTVSVEDTTAMLQAWAEVDASLVDLYGAEQAMRFRMTEDLAFVEKMAQEVEFNFFYGSTAVDPEKFMGVSARLSDPSVASGSQMINGGGTGSDNMSIWFITWSPTCTHLLYPEKGTAGLRHEDKGKVTSETADGLMDIYRAKYDWDIGMSVRDWRGIARIANIDKSALTADASSGAKLLDLMVDAETSLNKMSVATGKTQIYASRTAMAFLKKQALSKSAGNLSYQQILGQSSDGGRAYPSSINRRQLFWGDFEIFQCDTLLETEAAITFP